MNTFGNPSWSIAFVCVAFASASLHGQNYVPLIDTTNIWHDSHWSGYSGPNTSVSECLRYHFEGDTVIDGVALKVLRKTGSIISGSNQTYFHNAVHGYAREDTTARRIFIRLVSTPSFENLLYDLGAEIGPYPYTSRFPLSELMVTSIDTLETAAGPRRRLLLTFGLSIVEGVGCLKGFMPQTYFGPYSISNLSCHIHDGIEIINGPASFGCLCGANVAVAEHSPQELKVWPSPTSGIFHLGGALPSAPYIVRSATGHIVATGRCSANGSAMIDLTGLAASVYMLVVDDGIRRLQARVVKE